MNKIMDKANQQNLKYISDCEWEYIKKIKKIEACKQYKRRSLRKLQKEVEIELNHKKKVQAENYRKIKEMERERIEIDKINMIKRYSNITRKIDYV